MESTDAYKQLTGNKSWLQLKKKKEEKFFTYFLLRSSNQTMYGCLLKKWSTKFAQGRDQHQTGIEEANDRMTQDLLSSSNAVSE